MKVKMKVRVRVRVRVRKLGGSRHLLNSQIAT
jgi:hypothetical protein